MARNSSTPNHSSRHPTTLRHLLGVPDAAMDQAMAIAYQLYLTGHLDEAEALCRGLIACDPHYWWSHSLHASILRRLGRHEDALVGVEEGLRHEPGQPKLLLMRTELTLTIARKRAAAAIAVLPPASSITDERTDERTGERAIKRRDCGR